MIVMIVLTECILTLLDHWTQDLILLFGPYIIPILPFQAFYSFDDFTIILQCEKR